MTVIAQRNAVQRTSSKGGIGRLVVLDKQLSPVNHHILCHRSIRSTYIAHRERRVAAKILQSRSHRVSIPTFAIACSQPAGSPHMKIAELRRAHFVPTARGGLDDLFPPFFRDRDLCLIPDDLCLTGLWRCAQSFERATRSARSRTERGTPV